VAGAGLTALVSALLLSHAGLRVAVIEARFVGAGTTGHTTAKLNLLQGTTSRTSARTSPPRSPTPIWRGTSKGRHGSGTTWTKTP
jgi:glycine/D-amino acid oxidase-like deaminating enzyme